ncbi:MAG TPA: nicotinate phosphoribosyltransferase [Methanomassiliicoccales archaeon]|nr:nicotinate phosphoribosyltransferase [Methanomassiliicoccales archaeon]
MVKFFAASDEEVAAGRTTDIYFEHTMEVLKAKGLLGLSTVSEFTVGGLPDAWNWGVFCGSEELIRLMEGRKIDLWGIPEGTVFRPRTHDGIKTPVLRLEGPYGEYCELESPALGFICYSSGVATMAARSKIAADGKPVMSFGVRRMHPSLAPVIDRSSYIGGCDSVSSLIGAETIGQEPSGTMPHALIIMIGDPKTAFSAFDSVVDKNVKRVALVDTYCDEKLEALLACEAVEDLYAVRLDTPGSRRGSFADIIREVRWEMDLRGHKNVKIFVSGGLDDSTLSELAKAGADGFGVGTSISNAPTIDFAMDIVEKEGRPVAKRGKFSGRKHTYRCEHCFTFGVSTDKHHVPSCPDCGSEMKLIEMKLIAQGKRVALEESPKVIRQRVLKQIEKLEI